MIDLNSLCAAVAQSAAALVAIVAGFVLSHLLSLSGEHSHLRTRLRDVEAELSLKREHLQSVQARLLRHDAYDLIDESRRELAETEGEYPLSTAMVEHDPGPWREDQLQPYWEEAKSTIKSALELFEGRPDLMEEVLDLERNLRADGLDLSRGEYRLYEAAWAHVRFPERAEKRPSMLGTIAFIGPPTPPEYVTFARARRDKMVGDVEAAKQRVTEREAQADDVRQRLDAFPRPAGLGPALALLAYIAATGIVLPLAVMVIPQTKRPQYLPWVILGFFVSGLVFFFSYLALAIQNLSPDRGLARLPRPTFLPSATGRRRNASALALRLCAQARSFLASLEEPPPSA